MSKINTPLKVTCKDFAKLVAEATCQRVKFNYWDYNNDHEASYDRVDNDWCFVGQGFDNCLDTEDFVYRKIGEKYGVPVNIALVDVQNDAVEIIFGNAKDTTAKLKVVRVTLEMMVSVDTDNSFADEIADFLSDNDYEVCKAMIEDDVSKEYASDIEWSEKLAESNGEHRKDVGG